MKRNYSVPLDLIDLEAEVDNRLNMAENWYKIKEKVIQLCEKEHKVLFVI